MKIEIIKTFEQVKREREEAKKKYAEIEEMFHCPHCGREVSMCKMITNGKIVVDVSNRIIDIFCTGNRKEDDIRGIDQDDIRSIECTCQFCGTEWRITK